MAFGQQPFALLGNLPRLFINQESKTVPWADNEVANGLGVLGWVQEMDGLGG